MVSPGPSATFRHIFVLGLAIKLGGCVAYWHNGFQIGVWGFFIVYVAVAVAYNMLNLCVAEITSIIVFPGGHFGYVRASLGPFWGFMAGMMGLVESVFLVSLSMLKFSQALKELFPFSRLLVGVFWWTGYLFIIFVHVRGGVTLWHFLSIATAITVLSVVVYLTGSIHFVNINEEAYSDLGSGFQGDVIDGLSVLYLPCSFFVGIDLLPTISEEVTEASKNIPRAVVSLMAVMVCVSIWLQIMVAGLEPAIHSPFWHPEHVFPLSYGFGLIFGISSRLGTAFSIAPSFLSSFGFMFVAGRQVNAMARSGLLPKILITTYGVNNTPIGGMLLVSVVALMMLFVAWYLDPFTLLFRFAISGSCLVYILVFLSFIQFRSTYSTMTRQFINPLGVPSAIVGILCFAAIEISVLFIYPIRHNFAETYGFIVFIVLCVVCYWTVVVKTQTFSEDEQKIFMCAYVINANSKRKRILVSRAKPPARVYFQPNMSRVVPCSTPTARGSTHSLDGLSANSEDTRDTAGQTLGTLVHSIDQEGEVRPDTVQLWRPEVDPLALEEG